MLHTKSLPNTLEESSDNNPKDIKIYPLPNWATPISLVKALPSQKLSMFANHFSDLYHPPIADIMQMAESSRKTFEKEDIDDDWSHVSDALNMRKAKVDDKAKIKLGRKIKIGKKWALKDFTLGRVLGKGRFATAYLAKENHTGAVVVLKVIYKNLVAKYKAEASLRNEIEIQAHLKHKNIVQIYGYFYDEDRVYLILEYAMYGDIFEDAMLRRLHLKTIASYVVQITKALQYMHDNYVIHRDLKLENIYISYGGQIKIGDFGWALHTHKLKDDAAVGTLAYMAPEMLYVNYDYNHKVDNWALGVVLYEMILGEHPFTASSDEELEENIISKPILLPSYVPIEAIDLILRLLDREPLTRIDLKEVLQHPFIVENMQGGSSKSLKELCVEKIQENMETHRYDLKVVDAHTRSQIIKDLLF